MKKGTNSQATEIKSLFRFRLITWDSFVLTQSIEIEALTEYQKGKLTIEFI